MKRKKGFFRIFSIVLALVTMSVLTVACGEDDESSNNDWPSKIIFGAVPAEAASSLEADYETTRAILIAQIDGLEEIDFFQATEYAGIIEGIIAGRIDVGQFGGFSYVIATNNGEM